MALQLLANRSRHRRGGEHDEWRQDLGDGADTSRSRTSERVYIAWRRPDLLHGYSYPRWLLVIGSLAWLLTLHLAWNPVGIIGPFW